MAPLLILLISTPKALLVGPLQSAQKARIEAQLVDLDWTLQFAPEVQPSLNLPRALSTAKSRGAQVIAWIAPKPGGLELALCDVRQARLHLRLIEAETETARGEAAAIVLRSGLRALAKGYALTWSQPTTGPPISVSLSAGYAGAWAGGSALGQQGGFGAAELRWGALQLGLTLAGSVGADLSDALSVVRLAKHEGALFAGYAFNRWGPMQFSASLRAGAALFVRSVQTLDPGLAPSGARTLVSPLVGLAFSARWTVLQELLFLELSTGVDAVIGAPTLAYQRSDGTLEDRNRLWTPQPFLRLGLGVMTFTRGASR